MTPDAEREAALARRALAGDRSAAHELVESHLGLALGMARQRRRVARDGSMPDLEQEASLALLHAAGWYDPDRGGRFAAYAGWWIRLALRRYAREHDHAVPLTRKQVVAAARAFRQLTQGEPSAAELAAAVGVDEHEAVLALGVALPACSLDEPLRPGSDRTAADGLVDPGPDPEQQAIASQQRDELARRLTLLSPLEARVVTQRAASRSLREVAQDVGRSHVVVREIERRALRLLGATPQPGPAACARGHAWTDATSYVGADGSRRCRPCRMERRRLKAHAP